MDRTPNLKMAHEIPWNFPGIQGGINRFEDPPAAINT
jgi:hypothetical protein